MSRVFLAEENRPGRQVVIEVLPPEMILATESFERKRAMARATGRIVSPAASCTADLLLVGGRPR